MPSSTTAGSDNSGPDKTPTPMRSAARPKIAVPADPAYSISRYIGSASSAPGRVRPSLLGPPTPPPSPPPSPEDAAAAGHARMMEILEGILGDVAFPFGHSDESEVGTCVLR
ncbi:hypothetical protein EsH8_II_000729 [Colletotrichum jinshuiense]